MTNDDLYDIGKTSSLFDLEDGSLSFIRHPKYLRYLQTDKEVWILAPWEMMPITAPANVHIIPVNGNVEYEFALIHNKVHEHTVPKPNVIGNNCDIHPTALIGINGRKYVQCPDGTHMHLKEVGNVILEDNVDVNAYSIIRRSVMGSSILRKGVKICAKVNVGHNCDIGENTLLSPGVLIGGSSTIGRDCYLWQGVATRSHINICDNVIVGIGSTVLEDITKPGVYFGSPCKWIKPYDARLR